VGAKTGPKPKPKAPKVVRDRCGAQTRTEDKHPCRLFPLKYSKRCRKHGGKTPGAVKAAERARAEEQLNKYLKRLDMDPEAVEDPLRALADLAGEVTRWKNLARMYVQHLESLRYSGFQGGEQIRGEVVIYERALDRCVHVLATIAKLNIDERLAAIDERQAATVDRALTAALEELGLPEERRREASAVLNRHLRLVG
jgi:hypothetical protein